MGFQKPDVINRRDKNWDKMEMLKKAYFTWKIYFIVYFFHYLWKYAYTLTYHYKLCPPFFFNLETFFEEYLKIHIVLGKKFHLSFWSFIDLLCLLINCYYYFPCLSIFCNCYIRIRQWISFQSSIFIENFTFQGKLLLHPN